MKGIILCSLFLIVAICCSYGAPVETQPSAKKSARAVGASISTRVHIKPTSTKSYIDTHPHPKKRHLKRHHRLQYRRPRHKLIYPLKARLQYYGGEHIPLMPSAKAKHEEANIEMTNGEVFEHGGVPDLRSKSVIGGKRRIEEEDNDVISSASYHNHSNGTDKNSQSRDNTKVGTGLHYLFQENDSGSADEYDLFSDDTSEFEDVGNYTNNVGHNAKVVINILPREDTDNEDVNRLHKSKGTDGTFNKTALTNSSSHSHSHNRTVLNNSTANNSNSTMKSQGNLIGDEDDTLIENTQVFEIPTNAKEFGKEHNKIVLNKSPLITSNLTNETLANNSTQSRNTSTAGNETLSDNSTLSGNVSIAANETLANNSTHSGNVSTLDDETSSKNYSRSGNVSQRDDSLNPPHNCDNSFSEKRCDASKAIGAASNTSSNTFDNEGVSGRSANDSTQEKPGPVEEQKMYNDLHKFIEKLVSFEKAHRSFDYLNVSKIENITKLDQQRSLFKNGNATFDKLHNFVENLVFLDKSIYLVEHIGENSTSSNINAFPFNGSVRHVPRVKSLGYDVKDRISFDNSNRPDVKDSVVSDKITKTTQRSNTNDAGRFMDIVFSDNSTKSMNSSSGINIETLKKLHANMDHLVSLCLGFDSEDKRLSNKKSGLNSNEMAIRVHTSTGDLVLSCGGLNSAYGQTPSQKTSKPFPNALVKTDKMTMSKPLSSVAGRYDKMADVFLTKRNEKHIHAHELQSKRHQTTHVNYSTNSTNAQGDNNTLTKKAYQVNKKKTVTGGYGNNHKPRTSHFVKKTSPYTQSGNGSLKRPLLHKAAISQNSHHPMNKEKSRNGTSKRPQIIKSDASKVVHHPRNKTKFGKLNGKSVKFGNSGLHKPGNSIKAGNNNTTDDNTLFDYSSQDFFANLSRNKIQTKSPNRLKAIVGFLSQFDTHVPRTKRCNSVEDIRTCGTQILPEKHLKAHQLTSPRNDTNDNDLDIISNVHENIASHQLPRNVDKMHHRKINSDNPFLSESVPLIDEEKVALQPVAEYRDNPNNVNYDGYYNDDDNNNNIINNNNNNNNNNDDNNNNNGVFNYGSIAEGDEDGLKMLPNLNPNVKIPPIDPDYQNDRMQYADLLPDANTPEEERHRLVTDHMVAGETHPGDFYDSRSTDDSEEYLNDIAKPQVNAATMMVTDRINDVRNNQIHLYTGPPVHFYKPGNGKLNSGKTSHTAADGKIIESWY